MIRAWIIGSFVLLALGSCQRNAPDAPAALQTSNFDEGPLGEPATAEGMPAPEPLTDEEAETAFAEGAYYGQPPEERAAQQSLPRAQDALWRTLATTHIGEDAHRGTFTATHPPEVQALVGRELSLSGFIMPLETTTQFRHFLLTRYTPVCSFCPPGAPNEVVEVWSDAPISQSYDLMRVSGRFGLTNDGEMGLFFRLRNAEVARAQ